jgi:hypothetical protein
MKLYRVKITRVMYVRANDASDAEEFAALQDRNDAECETVTALASRRQIVHDGWWGELPYDAGNATDDRTIGEQIKSNPELVGE